MHFVMEYFYSADQWYAYAFFKLRGTTKLFDHDLMMLAAMLTNDPCN